MTGGLPIDPTNPEAWPEYEAHTIIEYATRAGVEDAVALVREVRRWLGNREVLMQRIVAWDPDAAVLLLNSHDDLVTAHRTVSTYWEGAAFDQFDQWHTGFVQRADEGAQVLRDMAQNLQEMDAVMVSTYNSAVRFIIDTASSIIAATGGSIAALKDRLGVLAEVLGLLADFVNYVGDIATAGISNFSTHQQIGLEMQQTAARLRPIQATPVAADLMENWSLRPSPERPR